MKAFKKWISFILCLVITVSLLPAPAAFAQESASDVVLQYDFANIVDNVVPDISGNGYNGTIVSADAKIRTGVIGDALDIGSGCVQIPAAVIKDLKDVTVVAQVYIEDSATTANRTKPTTLFSAGYGSKQKAYFMINTQSFNLSQYNLLEGCGYTIHTPNFSEKRFAAPLDTVAVPGQWNTLVMTQSGTTVKFYLNGTLIFTKENVTATMGDVYAGEDTPVLLGGSVWNDASPDGWYNSFTIYNRAMSADEIPGTGLVLDYQFEGMTDNDTTVRDISGNGFDGTLASSDAKVVSSESGDALDIGSGYVKIPAEAIKGLTDVTVLTQVYIDSRVVSTGNVMKPTTAFSAGYANKKQSYFMLNTQSFDFGKYHEGCGFTINTPSYPENRMAAPVDTYALEGQWNTLAMTQSGTTVKIYLNGELVHTEENVTATIGDVYAGEDTPVLLGGSVWGDYVPDGRYDYFRIYDRALAAEEIPLPRVEIPEVVLTPFEETVDYIERAVDFLINDGNALPQSKDDNFTVEWSLVSGEAQIVDGKLCKTDASAERQPVVLQAVISGEGETTTLTFENVTLIDPYVGYVLSFFGANGAVDAEHSSVNNKDEKFRMAYSYDGIHWAQLNGNFPVIYPAQGNGRTRDPFIMRNKDGSFTVLATQGWDTPSIYLWHSEYLTEFTNERLLQATKKGPYGLTGSRAWAPEGTYDPVTDQYFIYWSDPSANGSKGATYYNTSEDLETLSEPGVLFDPGYRHLDANIIKYDGTYYLDFRHYTAYNVEGQSGIRFAMADRLEPGAFQAYTEDVNPYRTDSAAEGSFVFKVNGENKWYLYWDYNDIGKFGVMETTDLASGEWTYLGINQYMPHSNVRHGGAMPVTQKELDAIIAKWETSDVRNVVQSAENTATAEGPVPFKALTLPETAKMYLDNGLTAEFPVVWSSEGYEMKLGEQTLTGTITVPEGYTNTGNVAAVLTLNVITDTQAPVITGVTDGETYCQGQVVTIVDNNLDYVTVNGEPVALVGSRFQTVPGTLTIVAVDLAGNTASVTITVTNGHSYADTVVEPTCTQPGYTNHVCSICGYSYTSDLVPALGHSYTDVVTEPTHDMMGYTTHTCDCGHSYIDTFVAALDHVYTQTVTKEPTCTENGELTFTCECGESYTMVLPRLEHTYTTETVEATCVSVGYTVHTCRCGHSYISGLVPALGHSYTDVVTEPTHDTMGYTTHTCACGHSYVDSYTAALEHTYTQTVTTAPTCTSEGVMTFTCECGESYTMPIPKVDHSYTVVVTEPDCDSIGYTTHTCACGHSYVDALVPALGHSHVGNVTKLPTCTEEGQMTYTCACGDSYTTAIPKEDHAFEAVVTAPACGLYGYTTHTCAHCGFSYVSDITPALDCPSLVFTDVNTGTWYHKGLDYVISRDIMRGVSETEFAPHAETTRAMMATLLYRIAGEPSVEGLANPFNDVAPGRYYTDAVIWAASVGVVKGVTADTFAPGAAVTREQMVAMLYRFAGEPETAAGLSGYTDAAAVSSYAREAMAWAVENGIITGDTKTTLNPNGTATRAMIATVLMRYLEK